MRKQFTKIRARLWGPVGSVIIHVLIVLLLIKLVVFITDDKKEEPVEIEYIDIDTVKLDKKVDPPTFEDPEDVPEHIKPPKVEMAMETPEVTAFENEELELDFVPLDVSVSFSRAKLPVDYGSRGKPGRDQALKRFNKEQYETEVSVLKALAWLRDHQLDDGSWVPAENAPMKREMSIAISGLGLLAFLAHGETPNSPEFGPAIQKAIRFLLNVQSEDGHFAFPDQDQQNSPYKANTYAQAIATYAVAEAYGMTDIPALRTAMEKGVQHILVGQQARGGWDYRYDKGSHWSTSVSGWQMQAVKAAYIAGARNEGIAETLAKAETFFKSLQDPQTGLFRYSNGVRKDLNCTGISVLCLQLLGEDKSSEVKKGLSALRDFECDWNAPPPWSICCWYYVTQAKFHCGGSTWSKWNRTFAPAFIAAQNNDGSWTSPAVPGSSVPFGIEERFGPAYATALGALTLQVYYRFLPTYQESATQTKSVDSIVYEDEYKVEIQ